MPAAPPPGIRSTPEQRPLAACHGECPVCRPLTRFPAEAPAPPWDPRLRVLPEAEGPVRGRDPDSLARPQPSRAPPPGPARICTRSVLAWALLSPDLVRLEGTGPRVPARVTWTRSRPSPAKCLPVLRPSHFCPLPRASTSYPVWGSSSPDQAPKAGLGLCPQPWPVGTPKRDLVAARWLSEERAMTSPVSTGTPLDTWSTWSTCSAQLQAHVGPPRAPLSRPSRRPPGPQQGRGVGGCTCSRGRGGTGSCRGERYGSAGRVGGEGRGKLGPVGGGLICPHTWKRGTSCHCVAGEQAGRQVCTPSGRGPGPGGTAGFRQVDGGSRDSDPGGAGAVRAPNQPTSVARESTVPTCFVATQGLPWRPGHSAPSYGPRPSPILARPVPPAQQESPLTSLPAHRRPWGSAGERGPGSHRASRSLLGTEKHRDGENPVSRGHWGSPTHTWAR